MATTKEEDKCLTSISARTSTFQRLSISTSKKNRPSTSTFDHLKVTYDQHERKIKTFIAKPFGEANNGKKIHSLVPSCMKRKLSVVINTESSLTVKLKLIILANPTNEGGNQSHDENKSFKNVIKKCSLS